MANYTAGTSNLRIGMVGVGSFAQRFIPLFKAHPLVDQMILCDLDPDKLAENAKKHGIPETCGSLDELCGMDVDAAVIITQPWLHAPQATQALRAGMHAWSAVPGGISIDELATLVRTVEETGRQYMIAETSYYYPAVIFCREQLRKGAFGHIVFAECQYFHDWDHGLYDVAKWRGGKNWRAKAGSPPMHYATHSTSEIISVTGAYMQTVSCLGFADRHEDGLYDVTVNEYKNPYSNETALFRMSDGSMCRVNEFRRIGHPGEVSMSLYGTEGSFEFSQAAPMWLTKSREKEDDIDLTHVLTPGTQPDALSSRERDLMDLVTARDGTHLGAAPIHPVERLPKEFAGLPNGHNGSHQFLVDDFVRACYENKIPPNDVWSAARYTVPGIVAHESAMQEGKQLEVPDFGAPPTENRLSL